MLEVLRVGCGVEGNPAGQQQHEAVRKHEADGCTQLRPHRGAGALAILSVFAREQRRTGPFAAQAQALAETHNGQHGRCPQTNLVIGGQQTDDEGCQTHGEQCTDEGSLTANLVAEVAEDHGTEGARDEGDAEGREGSQKLGGCVLRGEEQHGEHSHCCGGVNVEIVELDGGTNERGENNSTARSRILHRCSRHFRVGCRGAHKENSRNGELCVQVEPGRPLPVSA